MRNYLSMLVDAQSIIWSLHQCYLLYLSRDLEDWNSCFCFFPSWLHLVMSDNSVPSEPPPAYGSVEAGGTAPCPQPGQPSATSPPITEPPPRYEAPKEGSYAPQPPCPPQGQYPAQRQYPPQGWSWCHADLDDICNSKKSSLFLHFDVDNLRCTCIEMHQYSWCVYLVNFQFRDKLLSRKWLLCIIFQHKNADFDGNTALQHPSQLNLAKLCVSS